MSRPFLNLFESLYIQEFFTSIAAFLGAAINLCPDISQSSAPLNETKPGAGKKERKRNKRRRKHARKVAAAEQIEEGGQPQRRNNSPRGARNASRGLRSKATRAASSRLRGFFRETRRGALFPRAPHCRMFFPALRAGAHRPPSFDERFQRTRLQVFVCL